MGHTSIWSNADDVNLLVENINIVKKITVLAQDRYWWDRNLSIP
jgi:hypothetical protein